MVAISFSIILFNTTYLKPQTLIRNTQCVVRNAYYVFHIPLCVGTRCEEQDSLTFIPYALRITHYALRITHYALRITPCILRITHAIPSIEADCSMAGY